MENFINEFFTEIIVGIVCTLVSSILGFVGGYYYRSSKKNIIKKVKGDDNTITQTIE